MNAQETRSSVLEGFLRNVNRRLAGRYGTPDLGNVKEVFGEIIFALLSTRSAPLNYRKAFAALRERFSDWSELASANVDEVGRLIQACGLHNRKAKAIVAIANKVFAK